MSILSAGGERSGMVSVEKVHSKAYSKAQFFQNKAFFGKEIEINVFFFQRPIKFKDFRALFGVFGKIIHLS